MSLRHLLELPGGTARLMCILDEWLDCLPGRRARVSGPGLTRVATLVVLWAGPGYDSGDDARIARSESVGVYDIGTWSRLRSCAIFIETVLLHVLDKST